MDYNILIYIPFAMFVAVTNFNDGSAFTKSPPNTQQTVIPDFGTLQFGQYNRNRYSNEGRTKREFFCQLRR